MLAAAMLPFSISIAVLSLVQGALVAVPRAWDAGEAGAAAQPPLGAGPAGVGDRVRADRAAWPNGRAPTA